MHVFERAAVLLPSLIKDRSLWLEVFRHREALFEFMFPTTRRPFPFSLFFTDSYLLCFLCR